MIILHNDIILTINLLHKFISINQSMEFYFWLAEFIEQRQGVKLNYHRKRFCFSTC